MKGDRTPLQKIDFRGVSLSLAHMEGLLLDDADMRGANLDGAYLKRASLRGAKLDGAFMQDVNLRGANLQGASLRNVDLRRAVLVDADFSGADLRDCNVFGVGAWNVRISETTNQSRLIVQDYNAPAIVVPGLGLAHFVYLLTQRESGLREVLKTVLHRGVLLLGRFSPERKAVLDALAAQLTATGHVPLMFDFTPLADRDFHETALVLAGLAGFVIVDLTDAKAVPFEVLKIVSSLELPVVLTLHASTPASEMTTMWNDIGRQPGVSKKVIRYGDTAELLGQLPAMITTAETIRTELRAQRKAGQLQWD